MLLTVILFGCLFLYLALGLPLAFVLGGVGMIGCLILWGPSGFMIASSQGYAAMGKFTLVSIPLFVLMAMLLERSGVAEDLYLMMHNWMGPLAGGLAIGTVVICTIFAAMAGISGAATVSMGIIALPQMLKRNYDKNLAMGSISAGGALGILIPPSVIFILYGVLTGVSIGGMFMGGVLPGLVLSGLFIFYIGIKCWANPSLGPPVPVEEKAGLKEKIASLKAVAFPAVIIILVLGGIYLGVCTPSEAAALGVLGAIASAAFYKKLSWELIKESVFRTARLTGMIIWILIGAYCFTAIYQASGAGQLLTRLMLAIPGGPYVILAAMQLTFFVLGCVLDPAGIIMICTPAFLPVVESLGFDPLWFGVLFCVNMEMAYLTPPFGFNLFYMRAVAPEGTKMSEIYRAILPFVLLQAIGMGIIILFPGLALWLPNRMIK
ncbi:MAG: TRAP transporter large permease subunit [Deltaproteobacteria bacterium]|nr:TRAP transporter large permease subunit [Deltaproteobacteria bacterium]